MLISPLVISYKNCNKNSNNLMCFPRWTLLLGLKLPSTFVSILNGRLTSPGQPTTRRAGPSPRPRLKGKVGEPSASLVGSPPPPAPKYSLLYHFNLIKRPLSEEAYIFRNYPLPPGRRTGESHHTLYLPSAWSPETQHS